MANNESQKKRIRQNNTRNIRNKAAKTSLKSSLNSLYDEQNNLVLENKSEVIPNTAFSNPFKKMYFKYIKKYNPYSKEGVQDLLKKFKDNVDLIKGNSNLILKKIDMSKVDYVFLDGGHAYETVMNDLECCLEVVNSNGTVLCDDYNFWNLPDVKNAIDDFLKKNNLNCEILCDGRFAKIEK